MSDAAFATPHLVCVTGMHRCGTSIAMRALKALGVDLGDEDQLQPAGADNPRGYWENRYLIELDDELLAHLGGSWDRPPTLAPGWESDPGLEPFRERGGALLRSAFAESDTGPRGMKDPRLAILLPFWRSVAPRAGMSVTRTVVLIRDPVEVVASLSTRNGFDANHVAVLWLRYVAASLAADPDGSLVVDAGALFHDLDPTLDRLADHLGLHPPTAAVRAEVRAHIDPSLRHHRHADAAGGPIDASVSIVAGGPEPVLQLARQVWNGGDLNLAMLPAPLLAAIAGGWLREPSDAEALVAARAEVVDLTERLRKNQRARRAAEAELATRSAGASARASATEGGS